MKLKKIITAATACLMLAAALTGCGCQAEKTEPTETEAVTETKVEETAEHTEAASEPVETAEAAETTGEAAAEATKPTTKPTAEPETTEDDFWLEETPVDTRPPIEVTLPDETQPYTDYEQYMDMTGEEQEAFFDSFENEEAFFDWFNAAKAEYEKAHPPVIIDGSTNIEIKP